MDRYVYMHTNLHWEGLCAYICICTQSSIGKQQHPHWVALLGYVHFTVVSDNNYQYSEFDPRHTNPPPLNSAGAGIVQCPVVFGFLAPGLRLHFPNSAVPSSVTPEFVVNIPLADLKSWP